MSDNKDIYIKSHVYVKSHSASVENKPHIEIHLTMMAEEKEKPIEKLQKAIGELSSLVKMNGGIPIVEKM